MWRRCSCGIYGGQPVLDLDYAEDSVAGTDANFVMTGDGGLIEVQGSAEGATFSRASSGADGPGREGRGGAGGGAEGGDGVTRRLAPGRLVVATHNLGKLEEFRALLAAHPVELVSAGELGLAEPAETEEAFVGNARIKAHAAAAASGLPALADDFGIEIDALDGAPGVYTADWAEGPGGRDFVRAMTRARRCAGRQRAGRACTARFRVRWSSPGPTGTRDLRGRGSRAAASGRCVAIADTATIRCSSRTAIR